MATEIFSGTTPLSGGEAYATPSAGVPFIRSGEINEDGTISTEVEISIKVDVHEKSMKRSQLHPGDVLIAIVGATIGKVGVYSRKHPANINQAIAAVRTKPESLIPEFLSYFLLTAAGQGILDFLKRPVARANINLEEIATIPVLVPSIERQALLVRELDAARESRKRKLKVATELIEGIDSYVTAALGLESVEVEPSMCFAVRLEQLQGNRIDVPFHQPLGIKSGTLKYDCSSLEELAEIGANSGPPGAGDDELVPYVGLPECDDTSVREVVLRPHKEVRGRGIVKLGDILFARIEPSVFNRKYVFVETLVGHQYAYTSTEFYVVKAMPGRIEQLYLYAMFFSPFLQAQIRGKTTGSSGRRRIDGALFRRLQIPVPPVELQIQIAEELVRRRREASRLQIEADEEWQEAKRRFEAELLTAP